jgi:predicted nucleic acid-binding protein
VGVALAFAEPLSGKAQLLFDAAIADTCACCVHELFYIECAHAARKWALRGDASMDDAVRGFELLTRQPLQLHPVGPLVTSILDVALSRGISAYDASYVALGLNLGLPLVTADRRLVRALSGGRIEAVYLGDLHE